jgi:tetratricopeptide (TPR) repeat protein
VRFSGASSLENTYYVDGVNARSNGTTRVSTDTMSGLGLDHMARYLQSNVFAFGLPRQLPRQAAAAPTPSAPPVDDVSPLNFTQSPYTDELAVVMTALLKGNRKDALAKAAAWQSKRPGELASLIGLGEALEAAGALDAAARAYGSIIDLYPNRFELVRAAGERFDRLGRRELAVDAYKRSLKERPDQLSTYRLLAFALFRTGKADEALDRLLEARSKASSSVREVMLQDAKVIAASIAAKEPSRRGALEKRLGTAIPTAPSLHVVLAWETDANDVDLHVVDKHGDHAFYSKRSLASGGTLLDDLTDGYGPEMFSISKPKAFPYQLAVHYYNRGPMGLGIGTVQVIRHDGKGNLAIEDRPFVLQTDGATIPLGTVSDR